MTHLASWFKWEGIFSVFKLNLLQVSILKSSILVFMRFSYALAHNTFDKPWQTLSISILCIVSRSRPMQPLFSHLSGFWTSFCTIISDYWTRNSSPGKSLSAKVDRTQIKACIHAQWDYNLQPVWKRQRSELLLVLGLLTLKIEAIRYFETLLSIPWSTQRNISKYLNFPQDRCENLKSHISLQFRPLAYDRLISTQLHNLQFDKL